uniref:Uncharacterized protein n=1 Tax=Schistosoma curassoni TaxID=6186 RepID=A0A183JGU0_9TREM
MNFINDSVNSDECEVAVLMEGFCDDKSEGIICHRLTPIDEPWKTRKLE